MSIRAFHTFRALARGSLASWVAPRRVFTAPLPHVCQFDLPRGLAATATVRKLHEGVE